MPTPVGVARQCLAEAAAAVLDDAVGVAKRRSHSQTTSLHIVSALLALPSSTLREACTRARSSAYSPRLQFRALELCVGVALDRVSVSKSAAVDEPPISNSLMAAIKRSQANQRRHPETFHLYQQQLNNSNPQNPPSISAVKVELKHFVMSILDDPIVSRVFGDAGFRTHEIKLAILNPLTISRFSSTTYRPPPLFSCSLSDFELNKRRHSFPFSEIATTEKIDDHSRRIGEIISKKNRRNPLLIGVYASDSYKNFSDSLKRGETGLFLPKEINRLNVVSIENEISDYTSGSVSKETIELKFKQVDEMVGDCQGGHGIIVNCGDFKKFVDVESVDVVNYIVSKLKRLLSINPGGKLWLIGFLASDDDFKKLLERFPSIEMDLDLHLLPVTSSSSIGGKCFQSSLMRSFVPFGGFFSMPSELESQSQRTTTTGTKSSRFCNSCNEKYEQEVSSITKGVMSTDSIADRQSVNLPSWLQISECETSKRSHVVEAKEDKTVLDARVAALQKKWSDICKKLHSSWASQENIPSLLRLPLQKDTAVVGSLLNLSRTNDLNIPTSFTTDLTLGTVFDSAAESRKTPILQEYYNGVQKSECSRSHENKTPSQVSQSLSCSRNLERKSNYGKELEPSWKLLAEKVYWQMEAVHTISRTVSNCRNGNRRDIWFSFMGPDKIGKRKIAASVAEIVFGRNESLLLLSLDVSHQDVISIPFNSVVDCYDSKYHKLKSGRKMVIDYLAEEISKHPHSVVLLENVEKADFLVRDSLCQAVKTGKFIDSHGRDINVNNTIFILASTVIKGSKDLSFGEAACEFPEEKILEAKNLQMQIIVGSVSDGIYHMKNMAKNVSVTPIDSNKRKLKVEISKRACKLSRSVIDLNLPLEDMEDDSDGDDNCSENSEEWLEELLEHVHENVTFKTFEFDNLARKILDEIDLRLKKLAAAAKIWLEIDREVMVQIVAAAFLADSKNALDDWIEQVLCVSIDKACQRFNVSSDVVMKLVHCDGLAVEMHASGVCLPARINVR